MTEKKDYTIASVVRALKILKLFDINNKELTLTELSIKSEINKSSVLRVMESLEQEGFVKYNIENKKYSLGIEIFKLSNTAFKFLSIKDTARPYLKQVALETKLTVHLSILESDRVIVIDRIWPNENIEVLSLMSQIGGEVPIHCTGAGKLLIAFLPSEIQERLIKKCRFERYSENTITDENEFRKILIKIRQDGYAINDGEHEEYLKCITYPIFDYNHKIVAAASISGLKQKMEEYSEKEHGNIIKKATELISKELGY